MASSGFVGSLGVRGSLAAVVVLVAVGTFAGTLSHGFILDDEYIVVDNVRIRSLANIPGFFAAPPVGAINTDYYRPVTLTSFAIDYALSGSSPVGFHATNVGLHALSALLAFLLLLELTGHDWGSFFGALVFAVHPVQGEVVYLVNNRTASLSTLFFFSALWWFLRRRGRAWSVSGLAVLGAAYFASLASKETGVVLPAVMFLADWLLPAGDRTKAGRRREAIAPYLTCCLVAAGYFTVRHLLCTPSTTSYFGTTPADEVFRAMLVVEGYALALLVLPLNLAGTYDASYLPVPATLFDPIAAFAFAMLFTLVAAAYGLRKRAPLVSFAIGFYFIALATTYQIIRLPILFGERFLYLPLFGLSLLVALGIRRATRPTVGWVARASVAALCGLFAWSSAVRARDWRDAESFWTATVQARPLSVQAHVGLAVTLRSQERCAEANPHYLFALSRVQARPHDRMLFDAAVRCHAATGELQVARNIVHHWLARHPDDPNFLHMLDKLDAALPNADR